MYEFEENTYSTRVKPTILCEGEHSGLAFYVVSYGTHPCCYVQVPKGHQFYGKDYSDIEMNCHGGVTFTGWSKMLSLEFAEGFYLGWDYAQQGDYLPFRMTRGGKKWTTEEMIRECEEVIGEILNFADVEEE